MDDEDADLRAVSDIYGHANSTCVMVSRRLNGLGGSADFFRSAKISITPYAKHQTVENRPRGSTL